jgi:hypothetical protein
MRWVLLTVFCLALSCVPSEEEIKDYCQTAADDAVAQCEDYYRYTVLPEILGIIKQVCVD